MGLKYLFMSFNLSCWKSSAMFSGCVACWIWFALPGSMVSCGFNTGQGPLSKL